MTHKQHYNFYVASCVPEGGIYYCSFAGGKAGIISKTQMDRPMYMITENSTMHIVLRECFGDGSSGIVSAEFESGKLLRCSEPVSTCGKVACHLCSLDGEIYCVNYVSGSVSKLGKKTVVHSGSSVHPTRQQSAHTHYINSFDKKYLLCTDLGTDEIFVYDKDLNEISKVSAPKGHGPRHLEFKDGFVYCANELESSVSVFAYADGVLEIKNTVSVLPEGTETESTVAAIRIKGDFVYVSNRGHDSISVMKIDGDSLSLLTTVDCGGKSPRDFDIFGDLLVCTNETSNNVTFFELENGIPKKLDAELEIEAPLCVTKCNEQQNI